STRVTPIIPGVTFEDQPAPPVTEPPPPVTDPQPDPQATPPMYYPGIIVVTPPGNPDYSRRYPIPIGPVPSPPPATGGATPPGGEPPETQRSSRPRVAPAEVPRVDPRPEV